MPPEMTVSEGCAAQAGHHALHGKCRNSCSASSHLQEAGERERAALRRQRGGCQQWREAVRVAGAASHLLPWR